MTPKGYTTKEEKINWLHKMKKLCTAKQTMNRVKRQSLEWEKIFASHISSKRRERKKKSTLLCSLQ